MSNKTYDLIANVDHFSVSDTHTCTPEQTQKYIEQSTYQLKILSQNIRSINVNFADLQTLLHRIDIQCELLVLTECWLKCSSNNHIPVLQNYNTYHTTKHLNKSDGVVVYVKSTLVSAYEEPDFFGSASGLIIKLDSDVAILCIYRSPANDNIQTFLSALNKILQSLANYKTVIITGDINIDIKHNSSDTRTHEYLNTLAYHGFLPAHTEPTRGSNCLDHLIIRSKYKPLTLVYDSTVTDHYSTLFCLNKITIKSNSTKYVNKINYDALDTVMAGLDFAPILSITDPNDAADSFIRLTKTAIEDCTTTVKVPAKKQTLKPWITPGLLRCIRNRDSLHKKVKQSPDNITISTTYKRYRNFCAALIKKAKRKYDSIELNKAMNNPKKLWETIKNITNTTKPKHSYTQLLSASSSPIQSCNDVNQFFAGIGKNLADSISKKQSFTRPSLPHTSNFKKSFVLENTDPDEIITTINMLRTNAATGWDGISTLFLKRYATSLAPILCHMFNLCFDLAIFPTSFKKAAIHPILKGGDGCLVNNYRPIAVLSTLSKILERLMNKRLIHYLEHYNILSTQQFGFRKNKSTNDAIHKLIDNIVKNLDNNKKVLTIFLDLTKAFDTVPIPTLLLKLECIGVRGLPLNLFKSYLTNRSQFVTMDNYLSDTVAIEYGVPQGSILGPTLFLVFINDLCNLDIPNAQIVSYADDTAITFTANSWLELQSIAQKGFNTTLKWLYTHSLTLNTTKTNFITFSINSNSQPNFSMSIKSHSSSCMSHQACQCPSLTPVEQIKYLGIFIDRHLNFKSHINTLSGRVRKLIYIFKTLRHVAHASVIRNVYFALCQSLVTYCISCWGGAAKTLMKPLEIAHRAILKVATFRPILFPTTELYKSWNVLNVRQQYILHIVLLQHSRTPYRHISTRRKDRICTIPPPRTSFVKRFSVYLAPSLYNKINAKCPIFELPFYNCKKTVRKLLLDFNYDDTELFLTK